MNEETKEKVKKIPWLIIGGVVLVILAIIAAIWWKFGNSTNQPNEEEDEAKDEQSEPAENQSQAAKVSCQYCGQMFTKQGISRHEATCKKKPETP